MFSAVPIGTMSGNKSNLLSTARAILTPLNLAAQGGAPDWIMIFPAGDVLNAGDGRKWKLSNPEAVVAASLNGVDLPVDWEHAQDHKAPNGEPAPAAAWIDKLEVREGIIWGHVNWTEAGAASVASRSYRYFSPAFYHRRSDGEVMRLIGGGLVNRPAFQELPALAGTLTTSNEESGMDKELLAALGLQPDATKDAALAAVNTLKGDLTKATAAAETPSLDKFVPRADYDKIMERATAAETSLAKKSDEELEAKVSTLVDQAVKDGKVSPGSKDHYLALARKDFDGVEKLLTSAPKIVQQANIEGKKPGTEGQLSDDEKAVCAQMGIAEADFIKTKATEAAQ